MGTLGGRPPDPAERPTRRAAPPTLRQGCFTATTVESAYAPSEDPNASEREALSGLLPAGPLRNCTRRPVSSARQGQATDRVTAAEGRRSCQGGKASVDLRGSDGVTPTYSLIWPSDASGGGPGGGDMLGGGGPGMSVSSQHRTRQILIRTPFHLSSRPSASCFVPVSA